MKLGVTGSKNIKQFNPVLYFQVKEPNFRRFCIENGFGECQVSEIITGTAEGVEESARDWAMMMQYPLQTITAGDSRTTRSDILREIIEESDLLLICQDSSFSFPAELQIRILQRQTPVYQISELSNI